jgi:hypothetical protein|tara:strand:+ start:12256 stop:12402 length:147 start_codon:yes stop_codon:yes gene_type:complete
MARVKFNPTLEAHEYTKKKTSIGGGKHSKTMMNKSKRRSYKKYNGQGK